MKHPTLVYIVTKLELGGAQKICLALFEKLRAHGHTTYLISGTSGTLVPTIKNRDGVILLQALQRELQTWQWWREVRAFCSLVRTLRQLKRKHPNLIVHTHSTKAGLMGRWAAWCAGVKQRMHTVHGFGFHPHQNKIGWIINYLLELLTSFVTTHYICVSSKDAYTGTRLIPRFSYKHSIIRAAVDWQTFYQPARATAWSPTTRPFVFGTVACFKPQKNLFDLLRAFAHLHTRNPHTRLELVGDGALRPQIEQWIREHELADAVTLHGWRHDVATVMHSWQAFVLSSLWEGLPCAVVEARLMHLPVISYDTGGIHDVISHRENGLLCTPTDWRALAQNMLHVSTDHELHQKLTQAPDQLKNFALPAMISQHAALYQTRR